MPRVSVVIPTYEQLPDFLRKAVESVLAQSFEDHEIIVVDDGSTKEPAEAALGPLIERVRLIRQENGGPARARNTAIRAAEGELIAFLDSDDMWKPNKLARHVEAHDAHPEWALTYSQSAFLVGGTVVKTKPNRAPSGFMFVPLVRKSYITTCSVVVVQRDAFDRVGYFDESIWIGEDYDFYFRLAPVAPFGFIRESLAYYRGHESNITSDVHRIHEEKVRIFGKLVALAQETGDRLLDRAARRKLAYHLVRLARAKTRRGDADGAQSMLLGAVRVWPWSLKAWRNLAKHKLGTWIGGGGSKAAEGV